MKLKTILHIFLVILIFLLVAFNLSNFGWDIFCNTTVSNESKNAQLIENLKSHVKVLSSQIGERNIKKYEKLEAAADYIINEFRTYGYEVRMQEYAVDGYKVNNIIALKKGTENMKEKVVVGAHYDSSITPGADDNASGVAGLLELARSIAKEQINSDIEFVGFVNEEPPYFKTEQMGSKVYAKKEKDKNTKIKVAIILEMLGYYSNNLGSQKYPPPLGIVYPNRGNFLLVVGNKDSKELVNAFSKSFKSNSELPIKTISINVQGTDFSDNWSFWQEGYKAIMVTDTAFYRNSNYHKEGDTYGTLNYEYMAEGIQGILSSVFRIANR